MPIPMRARVAAVAQVLLGALLLFAVWKLLPARWAPIDVLGTGLAVGCLAGGGSLLAGARSGLRVARVVSMVTLGLGLLTTTALCVTVGHLVGSYGPVGQGGAVLMLVIALLILPYLVLLPLLQLSWLRQDG
jgi:hypothetical protein